MCRAFRFTGLGFVLGVVLVVTYRCTTQPEPCFGSMVSVSSLKIVGCNK